MATSTITTATAHSSDATFRAWAQEIHDMLIAIGMVNTGDTGQVDLTTMTRPSSAAGITVAGYKIYRTNDGYNHIYMKVEFGTGNSATAPGVRIQYASSTDGAGGLTGYTTGQFLNTMSSLNSGIRTARACGVPGCYWMEFKVDVIASGSGCPLLGFALMRFANASGAPTSDGYVVYYASASNTSTAQQVRLGATPLVSAMGANYSFLPGGITSGALDSDIQFWKHYTAQPRMRVNPYVLTRDNAAVAEGTQRELVVGGVTRNFIAPSTRMMIVPGIGATGLGHSVMLPWE